MKVKTKDPRPSTRPSWADYWSEVGNEDYLFARELIELSEPVRSHFESRLVWHDEPCWVRDSDDSDDSDDDWVPDPEGYVWRGADLDWRTAAAAADDWAASSTEVRLLNLVLSLVQPDQQHDVDGRTTGTRTINVRDLAEMGSWRDAVAEILGRYITGQPPRPLGARAVRGSDSS